MKIDTNKIHLIDDKPHKEIDGILFCLIPDAIEHKGKFYRPITERAFDDQSSQLFPMMKSRMQV